MIQQRVSRNFQLFFYILTLELVHNTIELNRGRDTSSIELNFITPNSNEFHFITGSISQLSSVLFHKISDSIEF